MMRFLVLISLCHLVLISLPFDWYVKELYISFVPYWIPFFAVLTLWSLFVVFYAWRAKTALRKFLSLFVLFVSLASLGYSSDRILRFYYSEETLSSLTPDSSESIKVFYANILYTNDNLDDLRSSIQKLNPDLLLFIEFTNAHYEALGDLLQNYPYSNRKQFIKDFVGAVAFSKFPLRDLTDSIDPVAWRYTYFTLQSPYTQAPLPFFLIHTSSPVAPQYFVMRNAQLDQFSSVIQKLKADGIGEHMVIAGDFNLSPWSTYYHHLQRNLEHSFSNISRNLGIISTWRHLPLSFVQTHIDHVWLGKKLHFSHLQQIDIKNSDHKGFYFVVHP